MNVLTAIHRTKASQTNDSVIYHIYLYDDLCYIDDDDDDDSEDNDDDMLVKIARVTMTMTVKMTMLVKTMIIEGPP